MSGKRRSGQQVGETTCGCPRGDEEFGRFEIGKYMPDEVGHRADRPASHSFAVAFDEPLCQPERVAVFGP